MTSPTTTIRSRLEQWKRVEEAATRGEWFVGQWQGQCQENHQHGVGLCKYEYTKTYYAPCVSVDSDEHIELIGYDDYGTVLNRPDAAFIAFARNQSTSHRQALEKCVEALEEIVSWCPNPNAEGHCHIAECEVAQQTLKEVAGLLG